MVLQVAMYEHLANMFGGPPNSDHHGLYSGWSHHNWGMIITGNVQVSASHLSLGRDVILPQEISQETVEPFRKLARTIHYGDVEGSLTDASEYPRPLAIMQLSHAGRQSPRILGGRSLFTSPLAPSSIALGSGRKDQSLVSGLFYRILFQTPQEMSSADVDDAVDAFTKGAKLAALAGFDGIQLHAAHGCGYFCLCLSVLKQYELMNRRSYSTIHVSEGAGILCHSSCAHFLITT